MSTTLEDVTISGPAGADLPATRENVQQQVAAVLNGMKRHEGERISVVGDNSDALAAWEGGVVNKHIRRVIVLPVDAPRIVCLCGSTRFWREFQRASLAETMAGRIVLSIGAASGTDDEHFGNLDRDDYNAVKSDLDALHKRKIDLADEVYVLNCGGYIGESTASEIAYAQVLGKPIRYLEDAHADATVLRPERGA